MSLFATANVDSSVLLMRIVTLSVSLGVFALAAFASPVLRDSQAVAWSICSIPLGMFLFASTNPSAWAVVGVAAMLPAAYAMFSAPNRSRLAVAVAASTLAAILSTSRADAPGMAAGVLGIVTIAYARRRDQMVAMGAAGALILFLGFVFLGVGGEQTSGNESGVYGGAFWSNLLALPGLLVGVFGVNYGLGWLDTPMPSLVWVPVIGTVAALSVIGLRVLRPPRGIVLAGLAFALTAYPLISLHLTGAEEGFWLQPRYLLPLILPFVAITLAPLEDSRWDLSRPQRWIVTASAIIATSIAVHVQLRRYATGNDVSAFNLNADVEWTYLQNVSPMALWVVATLAAAALFYSVFALAKAAPRSSASSTAEVVVAPS